MITIKLADMDRDSRLSLVKIVRENHKQLNAIYADTRYNKPLDTVEELINRIGYANAVQTVAELVRSVGDWDHRISDEARAWAEHCEGLDGEEVTRYIEYSSIHPAHIQQIAEAMQEYDINAAVCEDVEEVTAFVESVRKEIDARTTRSAWSHGVTEYANELFDGIAEGLLNGHLVIGDLRSPSQLYDLLLNGARDWSTYSFGGSALIYDEDIARRLCCRSELEKTKYGYRNPNRSETWLDVQARALFQAASRIKKATRAAFDALEV